MDLSWSYLSDSFRDFTFLYGYIAFVTIVTGIVSVKLQGNPPFRAADAWSIYAIIFLFGGIAGKRTDNMFVGILVSAICIAAHLVVSAWIHERRRGRRQTVA